MSICRRELVIVRGAGDLATGCIVRLVRAGFRVAALESSQPSSIRRTVCLSEALYEGRADVEGISAIRVNTLAELQAALDNFGNAGPVPIMEDPAGSVIAQLAPLALVDAIIAKRNLGTDKDMAPVVVALGPGFEVGIDADAVIETNRGHNLGRVLLSGSAEPNTGIPGIIAGIGKERVLYAPVAGRVENLKQIGDHVLAGEAVLTLHGDDGQPPTPVLSTIDGTLRGLIRSGYEAKAGLKVADVDPRCVREHCFTVSDKARAIAGGVLEAILWLRRDLA